MIKKKPIVALVIDSLSRGGAERVVVSLANNIDNNRYRCLVVTTRQPGEMASELNEDVETLFLCRKSRFDLGALKRLAAAFEKKGVDIVHSHNHSSTYLCRVVRMLCKKKWLHIMHDHHGPAIDSRKLGILDKIFLGNLDFYIGVSHALTDRAVNKVGLPENKTLYVPNGVNIPERHDRNNKGVIKIIQVGRLEPVKNHLTSIKAASNLKKASIPFEWLFVGRYSDNEYCRQVVREVEKKGLGNHVKFLGERSDVGDLLREADIGVLTSTFEAFSIAMLEYMAYELPIVITEVGHSSEIIDEADGGFVVPQDDSHAMSDALTNLIKDENKRSFHGNNNRKYVEANYSEKVMVNKVMAVYDDLIYV